MSYEPSPDDIAAAAPASRKKNKTRGNGGAQYAPDTHRLLPCASDAEQGVLCSFLLAPKPIGAMCEEKGVVDEWFHLPAHALIYSHLRAMRTAEMPIDFITLTQAMRDQETLDAAGGPGFISSLFTYLPTAANAAYYLGICAEKFALRQVIKTCTEYAARAYDEQDNPGELIDECQTRILAINRPDADAAREHIEHIKRGVMESIDAIEETYNTRGGIVGLPTGFHQLDRMTGGMRGPILIIVAGRPSMGKSALAMNIAEHLTVECGETVLVFSLEMNLTELASRLVCGRAKVNLQRVRDGFLSHDQMSRSLPAAVEKIAGAQIWVDETAGISIQDLRTRARRFVRAHPKTAAIVVDYLQLMSSTSKRARENRNQEISEISAGLKKLAKELNIPVIAGAQLNRDNDGANALPKLSNLRESGSIEQDADWVLLLHRRHYYTKDDEDLGKANVDLAKQRNGPTGNIALTFNAELARFENPEGQTLYSNNAEHRQGGGEA